MLSKHYSIWKWIHQQSQKNQASTYLLQKSLNSLKRNLLPLSLLYSGNLSTVSCWQICSLLTLSNNRASVCFGFYKVSKAICPCTLHSAIGVLLFACFCSMEVGKLENLFAAFTLAALAFAKTQNYFNSTPQPMHGLSWGDTISQEQRLWTQWLLLLCIILSVFCRYTRGNKTAERTSAGVSQALWLV